MIFLPSAVSHYNVVFGAAQELRNLGCEIIFAGTPGFKEMVIDAGFNFVGSDHAELFFDPLPASPKEFIQTFLANITFKADDYRYKIFADAISNLRLLLERHDPDIIIVDSILSVLSIVLKCLFGEKLVLVEIMLSRYRTPYNPPLNSSFIPSHNLAGKWRTAATWGIANLKFRWRSGLKRAACFGEDYKSLLRRWLKENGHRYSEVVNTQIAFGDLPRNTRQILMPSFHLEYPWHEPLPGQIYIGPIINDYGLIFQSPLSSGAISNIRDNSRGRKIIYCSLGSISLVHNKKCKKFLEKVISVFHQADQILVLSTGRELFDELKERSVENIHIFEKVPQLEVLRIADLMITHGGINSITECVANGVPMLVYPLNNVWDQEGNAARVVFHGLGLRGNFSRDSIPTIREKITTVLKQDKFRHSIKRMGEKFTSADYADRQAMLLEVLEKGVYETFSLIDH